MRTKMLFLVGSRRENIGRRSDPFADPDTNVFSFRAEKIRIFEETQPIAKTVHFENLATVQLRIKKIKHRVIRHQHPKLPDLPLKFFVRKIPHGLVKNTCPNLRIFAFEKERGTVRVFQDHFIRMKLLDRQTDRLENFPLNDTFLRRNHRSVSAERTGFVFFVRDSIHPASMNFCKLGLAFQG